MDPLGPQTYGVYPWGFLDFQKSLVFLDAIFASGGQIGTLVEDDRTHLRDGHPPRPLKGCSFSRRLGSIGAWKMKEQTGGIRE